MTVLDAVAEVEFENPATRALAEVAAENYDRSMENGDDKGAARWHAQVLACCRGRGQRKATFDVEAERMAAALAGGEG